MAVSLKESPIIRPLVSPPSALVGKPGALAQTSHFPAFWASSTEKMHLSRLEAPIPSMLLAAIGPSPAPLRVQRTPPRLPRQRIGDPLSPNRPPPGQSRKASHQGPKPDPQGARESAARHDRAAATANGRRSCATSMAGGVPAASTLCSKAISICSELARLEFSRVNGLSAEKPS
jgi:hypothetical protein